ncbi:hypothetical protein JKP88DRAFT_282658 [Tribonema minus]|uniref:Uncharacterized protein n=1 Tax=Tribonema minus TaxID=303371 RepID=A0A835YU70_9STRA|nr:hypothetical protein JKP88DRAFT_282658 [Tribonema minus]
MRIEEVDVGDIPVFADMADMAAVRAKRVEDERTATMRPAAGATGRRAYKVRKKHKVSAHAGAAAVGGEGETLPHIERCKHLEEVKGDKEENLGYGDMLQVLQLLDKRHNTYIKSDAVPTDRCIAYIEGLIEIEAGGGTDKAKAALKKEMRKKIIAMTDKQVGDTITLVRPETSSIIAGQNEIRRLFPPAAGQQLSLVRAPAPTAGTLLPLAQGTAATVTRISVDADVFQAFNNSYPRLQQFVASQQQRLPSQWCGYIIQINYHPLLFQKRLPDNSLHDVAYVKTTSSGTDFIFSE